MAEGNLDSSHGSYDLMSDAVAIAVVDLLTALGPDAVHTTAVANATGYSESDLDETYGHAGELLYLAWERLLRIEFEALVGQAQELMSGNFASLNNDETVSSHRRAAVHLLVVAHRFDELKEGLPPDVQRVLSEHETEYIDDSDRSVLRGILGWLCGVLLDPSRSPGDSLKLLPDINWHDRCWRQFGSHRTVQETPEMTLTFDGVSAFSQSIFLACTRIVAEGGVSRATLVRIARTVGCPPAVVYEMFGRQEHLLAQYMQFVFSTLFSYSRLAPLLEDAAQAEMRVRVWLGPNLAMRRAALLESVLASGFSPFLKTAYVDALEEGLADLQVAQLQSSPSQTLNSYRRFIASRQLVLGLAVLKEVDTDTRTSELGPFLASFLCDEN